MFCVCLCFLTHCIDFEREKFKMKTNRNTSATFCNISPTWDKCFFFFYTQKYTEYIKQLMKRKSSRAKSKSKTKKQQHFFTNFHKVLYLLVTYTKRKDTPATLVIHHFFSSLLIFFARFIMGVYPSILTIRLTISKIFFIYLVHYVFFSFFKFLDCPAWSLFPPFLFRCLLWKIKNPIIASTQTIVHNWFVYFYFFFPKQLIII